MRLVLHGLGYAYPDGTRVGPLHLAADTGIVRLAGANGTGKTTLMRVIGGVLPATEGSVRVCGEDPFTSASARAHIGAVSPNPELPDFLTATEAWQQWAAFRGQPQWSGETLRAALDLPPHLALGQMSSGQRRRAELLAALAGDPEILLLDETFTHLDEDGVAWLATHLDQLRKQSLVVLTHHGVAPIAVDETVDVPPARRP